MAAAFASNRLVSEILGEADLHRENRPSDELGCHTFGQADRRLELAIELREEVPGLIDVTQRMRRSAASAGRISERDP